MKYALLVLLCFFSIAGVAQTKMAGAGSQSFYAEAGGPGILFSANYDFRFKKSSFGWGARAGLGFVTGYDYTAYIDTFGYGYYQDQRRSILTIPLQVNYLFGKPTSVSAFEVGLGVTLASKKTNIFRNYYDYKEDRSSVYGTASFMYRRMPKDGGFSWRAGFTPIFNKGNVEASAGASVGYNF